MMKHVNRFSRVLSLVMVVAMLLSMMPASIFAVESTQTVYFQNNWKWTDVRVHYWGDGESAWPGAVMTLVENDGTYDIYSAEIPANVTGIIFNGLKDDGSGNRDQTPDIKDSAIVSGNKCYYMMWDNGNTYGTFDYAPPVTEYAVTFNGSHVTSNGAATAAAGEAYTATLTAEAAYALPASVSVSVGGTELTEGYTYDAESGALTIDAAFVTGDIVITAEAKAVLYLKPNSNWLQSGARFAIYAWSSSNQWFDMTDSDGDGYYEVVLPEGFSNIIFCRMSPSATANNWTNKWNQTADLKVPTDGTNCYTVKEGTWDKGGGTWSTYIPEKEEEPEVPVVPENDYYLVGYLNNEDYSGNDYQFVDGKLTVTFTADSYVAVKETSGDWYLAETYCTDTTVTLTKGKTEKMFVPSGVELTFALVENADGTLTLSYTKAEEPEVPEVIYIIAGGGMFGTEWDPANRENQMTLNADGLYEKVYTNVAAGSYEFKVTDGSWSNAWPGSNYNINVEAVSDVTVTFDPATIPAAQISMWFKAPAKEDDEFVSSTDDFSFRLDDLKGMNVTAAIAERGHDYYMENKVRYLCLDGAKGLAIVEGSESYMVEFEYRNGEISHLICECPCSYTCKHEFAAMLQLRETLEIIEKHYSDEYERTGYFAAISKGTLFAFAIDGKETGSFEL